MKKRGYQRPNRGFKAIHMPRNTGTGVVLGALATVLGFAMVWYMWWLAAVALGGLFAVAIGHSFNYDRDYYIPVDEVQREEQARSRLLTAGA
jgi:cytochrome o ubiquinol oxidase subunit I